MDRNSIIIRASWDNEAGVYVATTTDIHGLALEAPTLEELREKVLSVIPDLLELNGVQSDLPEVPVYIMSEQLSMVRVPHDGKL